MKASVKHHQIIAMIVCLLVSSSSFAASSFIAFFQMNSSHKPSHEQLMHPMPTPLKLVPDHCTDPKGDTLSTVVAFGRKHMDCSSQCDSRCATLCYVSVMSLLPPPLTLHNPKDKKRYFSSYKKTPLLGNYLDIYHPPI